MKKNGLLFFLCAVLLISCASPATTQPTNTALPPSNTPEPSHTPAPTVTATRTPTPIPFMPFTLTSPDPIVPNGENGAWDDRYTDPGAVIYHDGVFHMFRNGFRGFPATSQVGYVTSTDGFTWVKQGSEPIFTSKEVPYAKIAIYASSAIVEDDGTWVLYFYTWDSATYPISNGVIGRATASNPAGPWVADEKPLLTNGASGAWDEGQVLAPHVLKTTDGYLMYYSGADLKGRQQVGMATSTDGIQWKKYDDPATTDQPFAQSDPVLQVSETGWDMGWAHQPRVFQTEKNWVMIYRGTRLIGGQTMALGVATSTDGIHWEKLSGNPIFSHRQIPKAGYLWFHNALLVNGTYFLFVEGDINQTTHIFLATYTGEFPP